VSLPSGIELLEDRPGEGEEARKGDRIVYNLRIFLNKGDEVPMDELQIAHGLPTHNIRTEGGRQVVDRTLRLGKREAMPALEYALVGMKVGGYRKVRTSPHLAYREQGVPGLIPPNAMLVLEIWVRDIEPVEERGDS